ncbi:MAG: shikimate kinase [Nannocystaceae bacterium]
MGYYDPHPLAQLPRPLAIAGMCGAPVEQVAYGLASRTGIGYVSTDRAVEHELGLDVATATVTWGPAKIRALERRIVDRALRRRPPPVIALGESALLDPELRAAIAGGATLVVLDADVDELARRVAELRRGDAGRFLHVLPPSDGELGPARLDALLRARLGALLEARAPAYAAADLRLAIAGRHHHTLTTELLDRLDLAPLASPTT